MRNGRFTLSMATLLIFLLFTVAFAAPQQESSDSRSKQETTSASTAAANEGERKFATHCGRCHNPPQDVSPKAVPAVLRHMRVRAMLTEEDEKAILEFMGH